MLIKVRRKTDAVKITSFSHGSLPSVQFDPAVDEFEIPLEFLPELSDYFEPYFPKTAQEKVVGEFMLGKKKVEVK